MCFFRLANEAVVACWETELDHVLLMVTPDAHYSSTKYDLPIRIVSECDGLRVVGQGECGFIFRTARMFLTSSLQVLLISGDPHPVLTEPRALGLLSLSCVQDYYLLLTPTRF